MRVSTLIRIDRGGGARVSISVLLLFALVVSPSGDRYVLSNSSFNIFQRLQIRYLQLHMAFSTNPSQEIGLDSLLRLSCPV